MQGCERKYDSTHLSTRRNVATLFSGVGGGGSGEGVMVLRRGDVVVVLTGDDET